MSKFHFLLEKFYSNVTPACRLRFKQSFNGFTDIIMSIKSSSGGLKTSFLISFSVFSPESTVFTWEAAILKPVKRSQALWWQSFLLFSWREKTTFPFSLNSQIFYCLNKWKPGLFFILFLFFPWPHTGIIRPLFHSFQCCACAPCHVCWFEFMTQCAT